MITPKKKTKRIKPTNARILFIIDRSGSMISIASETIGGFNAFVKSQLEVPGKASLTLVQFDHEYLIVHDNVDLKEVPELTRSTFQPRGMTALYDAVGRTINTYKDNNPTNTKTIVAILTDGEENSSKEYTYSSVKDLITEVEGSGWEVMFIGANMNAIETASKMGIKRNNSVTFDYDKAGTMNAMYAVTMTTSMFRGVDYTYTDGSIATAAVGADMSKLYAELKSSHLNPNDKVGEAHKK